MSRFAAPPSTVELDDLLRRERYTQIKKPIVRCNNCKTQLKIDNRYGCFRDCPKCYKARVEFTRKIHPEWFHSNGQFNFNFS